MLVFVQQSEQFRNYRTIIINHNLSLHFQCIKALGRRRKECTDSASILKKETPPPCSDLEARSEPVDGYSWKKDGLMFDNSADAVSTLHNNPVLAGNINELRGLLETLPEVVADVY